MKSKYLSGILVIFVMVVFFSIVLFPTSIAKAINKDDTFKYTTSLTGNYDYSDKASVYTTDMDVFSTAKYIIGKRKPRYYSDLSNKESIQLTYDDYYILVYKGKNSKTFVQVSSRKFVHRNGYHGLYRPFSRNIIVFYDKSYKTRGYYSTDNKRYGGGYDKTFNSKINTKSRTGSTKSRSSLGGGLSFGK
ncbi:MAG: hypothetical protein FH753_18345 [Firmicutes bacterium]|nr:hypothetical protein [Bacillota bacterium]